VTVNKMTEEIENKDMEENEDTSKVVEKPAEEKKEEIKVEEKAPEKPKENKGELKLSKKTVWIVIIAVVLIGAFFFFRNDGSSGGNLALSGQIGSQVGDIAPDFSITDVEGNQISLSQFKGKPVIIGFFATWCAPCQIEANRVKQIDDETGGDKFVVYQVGIDQRENLADLKQFKTNIGNDDWIVGFGFDIAQQYNVRTLDTTIIIDKEGNIVYRDNGVPATLTQLRKYLT